MGLQNFVMVKFLRDSVVVPRESEWFGFYSPGQDTEILPLQKLKIYMEVIFKLFVNFFKQFFLKSIQRKFINRVII